MRVHAAAHPALVVGGGPAGLAAAYRLSEDPDRAVLLLERSPRFGGLAAGMTRDGMRLDFGPHRLHSAADPEVLADLRALLGDELELRTRRGQIFLNGRYLPFPPTARTLLELGPVTLARAEASLARARLHRRPPRSYAEAVSQAVGPALYRLFYAPYAEKVWGLPGELIAVEQAARRVNQRGPLDLLRTFRRAHPSRHFLYPRGGFGRIPEAYVGVLRQRPNVRLCAGAVIQGLLLDRGGVREVVYEHGECRATVAPEHVVWTAPLSDLVRLADAAPTPVREAVAGLQMRAVVIAYAQLARDAVGIADTSYFPESRFPFNRVMEQKRFSAETVPGERTVLVMDLACDPDDGRFTATDDAIREEVVPALEAAGLAHRDEITDFWCVRFRAAYPVYTADTAARLSTVRDWADAIGNLWLAGRQGLFLHNNTHHSLLMGYRAAAAIRGGGNRAAWLRELETFADFTVAD